MYAATFRSLSIRSLITELLQVLIHEDRSETELQWITSSASEVPYGAIVAGYKADGKPLYVAQVLDRITRDWYAGNYDPDKHCAECLIYVGGYTETIVCGDDWKIPIVKYGKLKTLCWAM